MRKDLKKLLCLLTAVILLSGVLTPLASATNTYNYQVRTDIDYDLNVRPYPNTNYASIGTIARGTKIYVSGTAKDSTNRNWGKITFNGGTAWVCIDYCTKITEQTDPKPVIPDELKVDWTIIDVSQFQVPNKINWSMLKAAGVKGVIIRIGGRGYSGRRAMYADKQFMAHYNNAKAAGMFIGTYFFSYALTKNEALEEAQFVIKTLKDNNCKLSLPVFIDIEDYYTGSYIDTQHRQAGTAACDTVVNTFCDTVKQAGYYPGIYCNLDYTRTVLSPSVFVGRAAWIAQWSKTCTYKGELHMWQYTDKFYEKSGYNGYLDASHCYVNFPKLISEGKTESKDAPIIEPEKGDYFGEHPSSEWRVTKAATCNEAGERVRECTDTDCGITLVTEMIQPSFGSHKRSAVFISVVDKDLKAGDKLTETQKDYLHEPSEQASTSYLTYEEVYKSSGGVKITYCKTCNTILTSSYSYGNGCTHPSVKVSKTAATCTKAGIETDICKSCSKTAALRYVSPVSHTEKLVSDTASCKADGTKTYKCSACGITIRTEFSEQTDHDFSVITKTGRPVVFNGTVSVIVRCKNCANYTVQTAHFGTDGTHETPNVTDARSALRMSVKLDEPTPIQKLSLDVDMDGSVSVKDARYILRMSVKLDTPKDIYESFK